MKNKSASESALINPHAAHPRCRHLPNPRVIRACALVSARSFKSICCVLGIFALLLGSARLSIAATTAYYFGEVTIDTSNCNVSGGLCQGGDPAACNGGQGPNHLAGVGDCPACNNGAGPNPAASGTPIHATVTMCEIRPDGGAVPGVLTASGTGSGFKFGKTYISLIYLNNNVTTCSRMNPGYQPTLQNIPLWADNDFASMMLGIWVVKPDGTAILTVEKQATVSGLNNYTTVSVREMQPPNATCYYPGLDPAPQLNALRACGSLTVTPGGCALPTPPPCLSCSPTPPTSPL